MKSGDQNRPILGN